MSEQMVWVLVKVKLKKKGCPNPTLYLYELESNKGEDIPAIHVIICFPQLRVGVLGLHLSQQCSLKQSTPS